MAGKKSAYGVAEIVDHEKTCAGYIAQSAEGVMQQYLSGYPDSEHISTYHVVKQCLAVVSRRKIYE